MLLADGSIKVYLAGAEGMSDQKIDALADRFADEVEAALDQALDALRTHLLRQFPKGMLTIRTEVGE